MEKENALFNEKPITRLCSKTKVTAKQKNASMPVVLLTIRTGKDSVKKIGMIALFYKKRNMGP